MSHAAEAARELRVLTYNLHHCEGVDGKLDIERIAKVILSEKPDLVALQEVDQKTSRTENVDQPARLAELTGMQVAFGKAMDYRGGGYGVAVLSRWPIQERATHPLPAGLGTEPRTVLAATIALGESGPRLRFLVTHVDHRSDATARTEQIKKIMELFPPAKDSVPTLLAGDLNATPKSAEIKMLLNEWTDSSADKSFFTVPVETPNRKIDYILYRPAAQWRVKESRPLEEAVASDHRAVLSVLEFIGNPAE